MITISRAEAERKNRKDTIRRILDTVGLPPSVVEYRLEFVTDSTGEPAFWVYFILSDDLTDAEFLQEVRNIKNIVYAPLWQNETGLFGYTTFRQKHEQDEIDQETTRRR